MRKYGFDNFFFEILEDGINNKKDLDEKEIYYIKKYNSLCSERGYNIELGGNSIGKHSEETKEKISKAQIGPKNHMYNKKGSLNKTSKPVIELTSGIIYESASSAAEKLNLCFSHVCSVARGKRGSTGGYVFRYLTNKKIIKNKVQAKIKNKKIIDNILPEFKCYI